MKTLKSGIKVSDQKYYKLLDWKDNNMFLYLKWCEQNHIIYNSINSMNIDSFNRLCDFAGVKD